MPAPTNSGQKPSALCAACGLALTLLLVACASTAPAAKHTAGPTPTLQPAEGGFQLTEGVRVPADAQTDYGNAMRFLNDKQYDQGIPLLVKVTERAPNSAAAYVDLGIAYSRSGDLDKAETSLKRALQLNPRHPVAYNELGLVYRRKGEFAAARDSYEKALGIFPGFHYARLNLAILCDLYLGDLACARDNYAAYQQVVPDDKQVAMWIDNLNSRAQH